MWEVIDIEMAWEVASPRRVLRRVGGGVGLVLSAERPDVDDRLCERLRPFAESPEALEKQFEGEISKEMASAKAISHCASFTGCGIAVLTHSRPR